MQGEALLRQGDQFRCHHRQKVGEWGSPLPHGDGGGELSQAGQSLVCIKGFPIATLAGSTHSCSEGHREMKNQQTASFTQRPLIKIKGSVALSRPIVIAPGTPYERT